MPFVSFFEVKSLEQMELYFTPHMGLGVISIKLYTSVTDIFVNIDNFWP